MANKINPSYPTSTIDPYKFLQLKQNRDGSVTRLTQTPSTQASSDPNSTSLVLTKDCPLNTVDNTFLRLFLPKIALNPSSSSSKLPVIVYFHGGGFVFHHANSTMFHDFCSEIAVFTSALVVSVEYRLAPEHRLPAPEHRLFLPKGLILHQPYFGGVERTESELNLIDDPYVPLSANDLFWELSLPVGADRDHEYSNPKIGEGTDLLNRMKQVGWRVLVTGCTGDPLVGRQVEVVKLLEEKGVRVKGHFTEGDYHAVEVFDQVKFRSFLVVVKDFMFDMTL